MENRKLHFWLLCSGMLLFHAIHSQDLTINQNGDSILTFEDGSWRYFESKDRIQQIEVLGPLALKESRKLRRWNIDPTELEEKINQYYSDQLSTLDQLESDYEKLNNLKGILERELRSTDRKSDGYTNLKDQIKEIGNQQKQLSKQIKQQGKVVDKARQLKRAKTSYQAKWLAKYENKNGPIQIAYRSDAQPETKSVAQDSRKSDAGKRERADPIISDDVRSKKYDPLPGISPDYAHNDCEIAFIGNDEFSNKRRIDVAKRTLFEYTHEELRPYFKDKVYMLCEGYLSAQPGFKYLTLEFTIASDRATQSFGALQKGSILTIKLIDDTFINLVNKSDDYGTVDFQNKTTRYSGQYVIDKKQERELLEKEIDQIRVSWTSGYEDYNIYELDFFKKQFECLNNAY